MALNAYLRLSHGLIIDDPLRLSTARGRVKRPGSDEKVASLQNLHSERGCRPLLASLVTIATRNRSRDKANDPSDTVFLALRHAVRGSLSCIRSHIYTIS